MNDKLTRRQFVKRVGVGMTGLAAAGRLFAAESGRQVPLAAGKRPNIVWIYCDELRTDALGCYGHPSLKLHTPNLDRLAQQGVRFDNHFCASPVCASSRVCSLSGLYPEDTGAYNNETAWSRFRLPKPVETFPPVFAQKGYRTATFGKLHVARGMYPGQTPGHDIFQHHDGTGGGMGFWKPLGEKRLGMTRDSHGGIFPDDVPYPPEQVVSHALKWMEQVTDHPYLVRISLLQPHTPVLPPARFMKLYEGQDPGLPGPVPSSMSLFERRVAQVHGLDRLDPSQFLTARLYYYALVAWVDSQVGRVLEAIERAGRRNSTIVVFGADHGNPLGDSGAFEKHTFTPTVHRVPLLFSWPGTLPAGTLRNDLSDSLDFARSLCGLAGIAVPPVFKGRNLFADPAPEAIYSTIGYGEIDSRLGPNAGRGDWYGGRGWPRRSCMRTTRYRLDKNMRIDGHPADRKDEDVFLADVVADPREMTNLAGDPTHADVVKRPSAMLNEHAKGAVEIPHEYLLRPGKSAKS